MKTNKLILRILAYTLITFMAFLVILPFLWMISASLKSNEAIHTIPIRWIPEKPTLDAYKDIVHLSNISFFKAFANSIWYSVIKTTLRVMFSATAAFIFAKVPFKGRSFCFLLVISTMMIPATVVMIPNYVLLKEFGLLNTYTGLIIPDILDALGIFMVRQYMMGIHNAYMEAAIMDGASLPRIFFKIMLPLAKPPLFTITLFGFMQSWNDYLWPLIVLSKKSKWTLQIALGVMNTRLGDELDIMMAGALISIIPILIIYLVTQSYVEKGTVVSGIKG